VMLKNNQWNKLVMEIPHLPHDKVAGITLSYGLQGNEPDAADTIMYFVDNMVLESVDADYYEGWGTDKEISFSHSGYNSNDKKTAFTSLAGPDKFKVVDLATNIPVLEKEVHVTKSQIGEFSEFDFTEIKAPGKYKIVYGNTEPKPFPNDDDVWLPVIEKISNQLLGDPEMHAVSLAQLEWMVGRNPFSQSLMVGEGYNFSPQYAAFTGDITGGLPVGFLTMDDLEVPYWKASFLHNYKELWGQPAFRILELLDDLYH